MELTQFLFDLESTGIATWVDNTRGAYATIESLHVLAVALVFGTIFIVDLRLLGLASMSRAFTQIASDLLRLTWVGFVLAVITGSLLFITNAGFLFNNFEFRMKMLMLLLAGINMLICELIILRGVADWDTNAQPPAAAKIAGGLSIVFWTCVIVFGRLIGFAASASEDPFAMLG